MMQPVLRMGKLTAMLALATLSVTGFSAQAALVNWGAMARTSVADCPIFCTNFNFGPTLGGENSTASGTSSVSDSRGSARASAALGGDLSTPVLRAESFADPNSNGAFATALGIQGYTYNGPGETLVLDVSLDGLVSDPEEDPMDTNVSLEVVLYQSNPFGFFLDRGTLDSELGAIPLTQPDSSEASVLLQLDHTNTSSASGQISLDVANGDMFYIWALLRSEAESGTSAPTSADAFNTGVMGFRNAPELTAAASFVVPLPAAAWLFASGLIGLMAIARRNKSYGRH